MELTFDRSEYLSNKDLFESDGIEFVDSELCEFNNDVEDMAYELAHTRYALAKAEAQVSNTRLGLEKLEKLITKDYWLYPVTNNEGDLVSLGLMDPTGWEEHISAPTLADLIDQVALMEEKNGPSRSNITP